MTGEPRYDLIIPIKFVNVEDGTLHLEGEPVTAPESTVPQIPQKGLKGFVEAVKGPKKREIFDVETVLIDTIFEKVDTEIARINPIRRAAGVVNDLAHGVINAIPFARKAAVETYPEIQRLTGDRLKFQPGDLIELTLQLLEEQGKFTGDELEFLNRHRVIIKRIISQRIESKYDEEGGGKELTTISGRLAKWGVDLLTPAEKPKPRNTIRWELMHESELLNIDVFELMKLKPAEFYKAFPTQRSFDTDQEKATFLRALHNIPTGKVSVKKIVTKSMPEEEERLQKTNDRWRQILKLYFDDPADIEEYSFPDRVENAKDVFELFEILNQLREAYEILVSQDSPEGKAKAEEILHEVNCARIKLILYLTESKTRQSIQYRRRKSVKEYLDNYLMHDIFRMDKDQEPKKIKVPSKDQNKDIEAQVLEADLVDPDDPENVVKVYLYQGFDSDKPEDPKKGIVNIKAMYKTLLKEMSTSEDVRDYFRITVMPVNDNDLERVRAIMAKTITHQQSRTKASIKEETDTHNTSSSYGDKDIKKYDIILSPYVITRDGEKRRGCIRDITSQRRSRIIETGPIDFEVRTGKVGDIIPELDYGHETSHKAFSRLRMEPAFSKLLPPEHYPKNWIGRAKRRVAELQESLADPRDREIPGIVAQQAQATRVAATRFLKRLF